MDRRPNRGRGRGRGRGGGGGRGRQRDRPHPDAYGGYGDAGGERRRGNRNPVQPEAYGGNGNQEGHRNRRGRQGAERGGGADNDRNNGQPNRNERPVKPLGYKMLEEIASLEPSEAVHRLAGYKKGLQKLLQEREIRFDLMIQLTSALAKALSSRTSKETLMTIVIALQVENFVTNHLAKFIREWPHMITLKALYKEVIPNMLGIVIVVLSSMLETIQSLFNDVDICMLCLEDSIQKCRNAGVDFSVAVCDKFYEFKDYHSTIVSEVHDRQTSRANPYGSAQDEEAQPEDDFHDLPIFPIAKELQEGHRPFLRKNIVNKGYESVQHYLDIQFRLLREDFVAPLRTGITEYRALARNKEGKQQVRLQDIYVYHDVQVLEAKPSDDGIAYITRFNVEHLQRIQWERSRRLLFGSLVCLSSDEFDHVIFAVVSNRKPEELKEGLIELKFHEAAGILPTLFTNTYIMAESSAYFEAYRHVLQRIQAITDESFPLEMYIIRADPRPRLPYYLQRNQYVAYDLNAVAKPQHTINATVANPQSWPPLHEFDLDSSQLQAFKAALTEELCCIQGPPGTGKTFIGLKIVETLLRNKRVWSPQNDSSPILLICFTNHALDQFLEGILEFLPEGIVRIGGRSSSDKLKDLNLKELRRNMSRLKKRPKHQYMERKNIRDEMLSLAKQMQSRQKSIRAANTKILKETILKNVMEGDQYRSLLTGFHTEEAPNLKTGQYIAFWLGAIGGRPEMIGTGSDEEDDSDLHADVAPPLVIKPDNRTGRRRQRRRQRQDILEGLPLQEYISRNLQLMETMTEHEYTAVADVWHIEIANRWRLYRLWVTKHQDNLQRLLRLANRAILRTNILRPFMKDDHRRSLERGLPRDVNQQQQHLATFLGVFRQRWTADELERMVGLANVEIQNEDGLIAMMQDYMNNDDETCRINIPRQMMLFVAKALTQIGPMNKYEADRVQDVNNLQIHERWRLYKYWVVLYCGKLQERLTVSRSHVLKEDILRHQMTAEQIESFYDERNDDNIKNIDRGQLTLLWLGAYSGVPIVAVQAAIDNLPREDGAIDIMGEAEMLNEDRFLDDENDEEMNEALEDIVEGDEDDDGVDIFDNNIDDNNQGWQVAGRDRRGLKKYINKNLRKVQRMPEERALNIGNLWDLPMNQRWNLYRYWVHIHKERTQNTILPMQEEYERQARLLKEVKIEEDVDLIKDATIIALTTTGASKYHYLIERVHPRIVVVEEAAEVLEAHIVTSLTAKCQHLILIGDHQQLRPTPTVYELAQRYHLDISLFERLIKNNFPKHRLNLQHRMRQEISLLLKIHDEFYPDLEDDVSVLKYEDVKGIDKNIFFLDHTHEEASESDDRSKSNKFEAEFLAGLCRYLLQQEYLPEQITILTAYTGQLWNFKQCMPKSVFGNVRVCPIDRYQGEENDIILLSLVRSNKKGNIGFLKIANRVCVALSRAKKGLYCVGNFALLSHDNDVWKTITTCLRNRRQLGTTMTLRCSNHPEMSTEVKVPKDFKNVPEGGCTKPCETRLDCGHVCPMICHPRNADHVDVKCQKKCTKFICDLNHRCKKMCYQVCEKECREKITKELECGHAKEINCYMRTSPEVRCTEPCLKTLNCGHPCGNKCGEGCSAYCKTIVEKPFKCGHRGNTECGNKEENCSEPCEKILMCGHQCSGTCGKCKRGRLHVPCVQRCGRTLICGHTCQSNCTEYCPPCAKRCENRCIHSKCIKRCGQPCTPCQEECEWKCRHEGCNQPCGEPCTRPPCNNPCQKRIEECGHQCIGICGETCPEKCRICHAEEVTEVLFGDEDEPNARFVLLEDCKHIIEVNALDTWMKQTTGGDDTTIQVKVCPKCKTPIRRNLRYSNSIKQARADVEHIKKQLLGDPVAIREKREELLQTLSEEDVDHTTGRRDLNRLMAGLGVNDEEQPRPQPATAAAFTGASAKKFVQSFRSQLTRGWTETQITSLEYKMDMFKRLCEMKRKSQKIEDRKGNSDRRMVLERFFEDVLSWLNDLTFISEQNTDDWNCEIKRISALIKLMEARLKVSVTRYAPAGETIKKIYLILSGECRYSDRSQQYIKGMFKDLSKYATGLGVSEEEREMIVRAVGLSAGHWFKCRNGHFYAIGECGGAMERGRCPECRDEIGGQHHQLVSTNRHAPEMDGSRHAAWSEAANMANFDPNEFR